MNLIKLSSDLIKFKSVTPKSAGSLEFIEKILKKNNFNCHLLEFGNKKIKNLYAEIKGGEGPNLCFAGHTDVVPAGNLKDWNTNPFKPTIKNGVGIKSFLIRKPFQKHKPCCLPLRRGL